MKAVPSQAIAGCFAMSAFAVAIIAGLAASNEASTILIRAVLAMMVGYPIGLIAGAVCERTVRQHARATIASLQTEIGGIDPGEQLSESASPSPEQIVDNEEIIEV